MRSGLHRASERLEPLTVGEPYLELGLIMTLGLTLIVSVALAPIPVIASNVAASPLAEAAPSGGAHAANLPTTTGTAVVGGSADVADRPSAPDVEMPDAGASVDEPEPAPVVAGPPVAYETGAAEMEIAPILAEPAPMPAPSEDVDEPRPGRRGIGLVASGATLVAAGALLPVGLGMRSMARTQAMVLETSGEGVDELVTQAEQRARNGTALAIAGGAMVAVGVPLLVSGIVRMKRHKDRRTARLTPNLALGQQGASLGLHMRF